MMSLISIIVLTFATIKLIVVTIKKIFSLAMYFLVRVPLGIFCRTLGTLLYCTIIFIPVGRYVKDLGKQIMSK